MHKFPAWYNITSPLPVLTVMVLLGPHLAFGLSRHRRRSQRQLLTWCSNSCSTGWTEYRRRGEPRGWRWSTKGGEEGRVRRRPTSSRPWKQIQFQLIARSIMDSFMLSNYEKYKKKIEHLRLFVIFWPAGIAHFAHWLCHFYSVKLA